MRECLVSIELNNHFLTDTKQHELLKSVDPPNSSYEDPTDKEWSLKITLNWIAAFTS